MQLVILNHTYRYNVESLIRVFFPYRKIELTAALSENSDGVVTEFVNLPTGTQINVTVQFDGRLRQTTALVLAGMPNFTEECSTQLALLLYEALSSLTGYKPQWGVLIGVRPAKLIHRAFNALGSDDEVAKLFENKLLLSPKKVELAQRVARSENAAIALSRPNSFSLYVSIPFCPTRCSYCSFVSHAIERTQRLVDPYLDLLCEEIALAGQMAAQCGLRLETVYFGGGTPTVLSAKQLERLLTAVKNSFDLSTVREYTVEAGRPDTITDEKLALIKSFGAQRISINPQTFNDTVLTTIGRQHTAEQAVQAFAMASSAGFSNINMDFIAALPGESYDSFCSGIRKAVQLGAHSITVHTLAMKSASDIVAAGGVSLSDVQLADSMLDFVNVYLTQNGYSPYYMYRQSKTVGNLENVGWCKSGKNGLYNVYMMDETHTIIACGAGAVTRLKAPHGSEIKRIYNFKYPYEYIEHFDQIKQRKSGIIDFYSEYQLKR